MVIVTLLTDFGLRDSYVAEMKGVILSESPGCEIVDISHKVRRHGILEAAFLLETAVPYFPAGTIHVAVVDPGVGSVRSPIIVKCASATLIGPDNGVLDWAANKLGRGAVFKILVDRLGIARVSSTFHGRDIFAWTAVLLAQGRRPEEIGKRLFKLTKLDVPKPRISGKRASCVILHMDSFGNIITNVPNESAQGLFQRGRMLKMESGTRRWEVKCVKTYSDGSRRQLLVLPGSQGYLEIAAREDSASDLLGLEVLAQLRFSLP